MSGLGSDRQPIAMPWRTNRYLVQPGDWHAWALRLVTLTTWKRDPAAPSRRPFLTVRSAVVHAAGEGDDLIAALAAAHPGTIVVTADRGLAARVRADDGEVVGPGWLHDQLVD